MVTVSENITRPTPPPTTREPDFTAITMGSTELRLARGIGDIEAAQELRYRVFYEEMGAEPSHESAGLGLDRDSFDAAAEHLLVIDHARGGEVVGTYRLLRRRFSEKSGGFYTSREFDISKLTRAKGEILELGRSCVAREFRSRATMSLLWRGLAAYAFEHKIELMFGCASFPGADPAVHAEALSYLHQNHLAPRDLRPSALPARYVDMNVSGAREIETKRAIASLPPLIKGYMRLGGWVGDGAVIDHQFNTTDVCIIVKMENLTRRYSRHYERTARGVGLQ
jgi:putative hemolysin